MNMRLSQKTVTNIEKQFSFVESALNEFSSLHVGISLVEPNKNEMAVIALLMHSVYNGIEEILRLILEEYDESPQETFIGENSKMKGWHENLLYLSFNDNEDRLKILEDIDGLFKDIDELRQLRHITRKSYIHTLKWKDYEPRFAKLNKTWYSFKYQIKSLIDKNKSYFVNLSFLLDD